MESELIPLADAPDDLPTAKIVNVNGEPFLWIIGDDGVSLETLVLDVAQRQMEAAGA